MITWSACRPTLQRVATAFIGVVVVVLSAGCRTLPSDTGDVTKTIDFDFDEGPVGFVAGFADYPPAHEEIYELTSGHRALPAPLASQSGLFISGVNRSDDLFMFFKGPIDGLTPGGSYGVEVSVEIATSTPAGCFGVGGAPGESVWIKAGVTAEEPVAVMDDSYLRMNIDIGKQSTAHAGGGLASRQPGSASRRGNGAQGPGELNRHWQAFGTSHAGGLLNRRRFGIREPDGGLFHAGGVTLTPKAGGMTLPGVIFLTASGGHQSELKPGAAAAR